MSNNRNQLRVDNNKINQLQNVHAVQVNLKELIVAYDGSARWQIEDEIRKYLKWFYIFKKFIIVNWGGKWILLFSHF